MDLDSPEPPTLFRKTALKGDFDPSTKLESTQVFVTSKDGTRVPMFIISPRGTVLDGTNPTLLYGYGGEKIGGAERKRKRESWFSPPRAFPLTRSLARFSLLAKRHRPCSSFPENSNSHSGDPRSRTPRNRFL